MSLVKLVIETVDDHLVSISVLIDFALSSTHLELVLISLVRLASILVFFLQRLHSLDECIVVGKVFLDDLWLNNSADTNQVHVFFCGQLGFWGQDWINHFSIFSDLLLFVLNLGVFANFVHGYNDLDLLEPDASLWSTLFGRSSDYEEFLDRCGVPQWSIQSRFKLIGEIESFFKIFIINFIIWIDIFRACAH